MFEYYKKVENGKAVGRLVARENLVMIYPTLDLSDPEILRNIGYCEYDTPPKPTSIDRAGLEEWQPGEDEKISDTRWTKTWKLVELELSWDIRKEVIDRHFIMLKQTRDYILQKTDFYALSDTPDMPESIRNYRQALRDMFKGKTDPFNIEWPVDPIDPERGHNYPEKG